jgi:hypothetical protein
MAKQVSKSVHNINNSDMFPQLYSIISEAARLVEKMY